MRVENLRTADAANSVFVGIANESANSLKRDLQSFRLGTLRDEKTVLRITYFGWLCLQANGLDRRRVCRSLQIEVNQLEKRL